MRADLVIRLADFEDQAVLDLIGLHVGEARANTPEGFSFALGAAALRAPDVTLYTVHHAGAVVGMGALKSLSATHGEVKSMRTAPGHLRKGVATAILTHLLDEARMRGYTRVSLETGTTQAYAAAVALYRRFGFTPGEVFADYAPSAHNQCYHLNLA